DGRSVGEREPRPVGHQKVPARSSSMAVEAPPPPVSSTVALAPVASAELPSEPSISDIEVGIARIVDATASCFARHTQSAEGVQITVHTALSLKVLADGTVT